MTQIEGKAFLLDRLQKCGYKNDIDDLILYKSGNKKEAKAYQNDKIVTNVDFSKEHPTVRFVVKCFTHLNIYAAWSQEICRGNGKCIAYKKDLVAFEQDKECTFTETTLDKGSKVYWFKGELGVDNFIKNKLFKEAVIKS